MKLTNRTIVFIIGIVLIAISGCGKKTPTHQLEVLSFRLNIPDIEIDEYFGQVTDLDITDQGEFIVMDVMRSGVLRFDKDGNYINDIAGYGSGNYGALCSVNPVDTLLAVNTAGVLEFFTSKGKPVKRHFLRGRGDVAVASDGSYIINRMYDSRRLGYCIETYNKDGKLINKFRTPRCTQEGTEYLDFAFSSITTDNKIIYVPAMVDSGFIYDFQGNLILAKKIKSKLKPYTLEEGKPGPLAEDMYVNEDGIFIVRVNKNQGTGGYVFFDLIEQYNFNFERIAMYTFSMPLTMTVPMYDYSPWYHKFVQRDGIFYFMVSQPFEQLLAFKVK